MATTSNAAMRKKTPFYVSIFMVHDTSHSSETRIQLKNTCEADKTALSRLHVECLIDWIRLSPQ
jgi:hypothetical protein